MKKEKVSIDDEINNLKYELDESNDINPNYMPTELKEIQSRVIFTHAHLEFAMGMRIIKEKIAQFFGAVSLLDGQEEWRFSYLFWPLLDKLSYGMKLDIFKKYDDIDKGLKEVLVMVNQYRNEFAHPNGLELRNKYDDFNVKGKQRVRDLLRCLVSAEEKMNQYFAGLEPKISTKIEIVNSDKQ